MFGFRSTFQFISISFLVLIALQSSYAQGIDFFDGDWKDALVKAEKEEKLVFVDAYAKWCGPCKKMAATTFVDDKVGEYFNANFISMKIDMEEPMGRDFGQSYPVAAYPTLFFLDGKGAVVKRITGFRQPDDLINEAKGAFESADFSAKYAQLYDEGARDFSTVHSYVKTLNQAKKPSGKIVNEYLKSDHGMDNDQYLQFIYTALTDADSKVFDLVLEKAKEISKKEGADKFKDKILNSATATTQKAIEFEYPSLIEDVVAKLKGYDKSLSQQYDLESKLQYAAAYKDWDTFQKHYKDYKKKYCQDNADRCVQLNGLLSKHFLEQEEYQDLTLENLYQIKEIDPTEKNYVILIQSLYTQQKYEEAMEIALEGKTYLTKDEKAPRQIEKMIKFIEQRMKG